LSYLPGVDVATYDLAILLVNLGVALLAVLFLGLEFYSSRKVTRAKVFGCLVLVIGMVASRFQASHLMAAMRHLPQDEAVEFRDVPVAGASATTDAGRAVALFQFEVLTSVEQAEHAILAEERYQNQVIRLGVASSASNCHGWVFTGGRFGIRNPEVPAILTDNRYEPVTEVREGDLAIYTTGNEITHSGLVRVADSSGRVLVESKWGPFGVFLHAPESQPFSGTCAYYRSSRKGHLIGLPPMASEGIAANIRAMDR
jgi:hypothetical protein